MLSTKESLKNFLASIMVATTDTTYRVGDWVFSPHRHELQRPGLRVRLEHRTAALLAYLCKRRGQVVLREEWWAAIVAAVARRLRPSDPTELGLAPTLWRRFAYWD